MECRRSSLSFARWIFPNSYLRADKNSTFPNGYVLLDWGGFRSLSLSIQVPCALVNCVLCLIQCILHSFLWRALSFRKHSWMLCVHLVFVIMWALYNLNVCHSKEGWRMKWMRKDYVDLGKGRIYSSVFQAFFHLNGSSIYRNQYTWLYRWRVLSPCVGTIVLSLIKKV